MLARELSALRVVDLDVRYAGRPIGLLRNRPAVHAVNGVSFSVSRGKCFALVGESGSGKTSIGRAITHQIPYDGEVWVDNIPLFSLGTRRLRMHRPRVQIVFQNPFSSLNPALRIGRQLREASRHSRTTVNAARLKLLLQTVGMPENSVDKYPHQFSGGQCQRLSIARALIADPDVIVLDEAFSSLDMSVQAQILHLLEELKATTDVALVLISHDLAVVRHLADDVGVLYAGQFVERGEVAQVYERPIHPYTKLLLTSAFNAPERSTPVVRSLPYSAGGPPDPSALPSGCRFNPRCPWRQERCAQLIPALSEHPHDPRHLAACHFASELASMPWPKEEFRRPPRVR